MLNGYRVIDADGHVNDWHIDWAGLAPPELREQAPKAVRDENGFPQLEAEGKLLPGEGYPSLDANDVETLMAQFTRDGRYWLPRPGEADPKQRLPDMDEMGIDVAVLFGGHAFLVAAVVESPEIARAGLHAYNRHLAAYCSEAPERLKGTALLPLQAPQWAAEELRTAVRDFGFVGGVIPPHHADGTTLDDPALEPIWNAAEELGVPICVHTLGLQINPARTLVPLFRMREAYGGISSMISLGHLIMGGVLDRHPALRIAYLESGAGWVPYFMERLQEGYRTFSLKSEKLARDPEEYVKSDQLYFATEPDEPVLPAVAQIVGEDRIILGSDYCHPEGMCPFTMKALAEREDLSAGLKRKILDENPARLYGL